MALDPNIILGVRPVQDPMESMGRAMSLAQLAQQGQLQRLQIDKAQRDYTDEQTLADLYRGAIKTDGTLDRAALLSNAATRGLGAKIPALQKTLLETDAKQAELEKLRTETAGLNYGQLQKRVEATNGALTSLLARPQVSHQDVLGAMQGLVQQGLARPEEMQAAVAQIPQDPAALRPWLEQKRLEGLTAAERLKALTPDLQQVNDGQVTRWVDKNAITNPTGPAPVQMRMTPGEVASNGVAQARLAEERRHNGVTEGQGGTVVEKDAAGNFVVVDKRAGTARSVMGADGKPVGTGAAVKDAGEALQLINQAIPLLSKSTGSYGGWAVDQLAQAFGKATDGSIAAGQLKAIEGALVAKMPKMSGPQSDKDVLLYRQMAAEVGNDTVPMERKAAALETLREIQERYAGVAPGSSRPKPQNASQRHGGASGDWNGAAPTRQQPMVEASATMGGKQYVKRGGNWYEVTP
jgi:hypothetical protein